MGMPMGMAMPMAMPPVAACAPSVVVGGQQGQDDAYKQAMAVIKAGAGPAVNDAQTGTSSSSTSRSDVNSPAYRPPNTEPIFGVTDRRWEGYIRLFIEDSIHGYGFIKCKELQEKFPDKDVFLHRNQRNGFNQGDTVTFAVFMNYRGMPQATDLRRPQVGDGDPLD